MEKKLGGIYIDSKFCSNFVETKRPEQKLVRVCKETFEKFIQQYPRHLHTQFDILLHAEMCMYLDNMKYWEGHEDYCGDYLVASMKESYGEQEREYYIDREAMERYPVRKGEVERNQLFRGIAYSPLRWLYGSGVIFGSNTYIVQEEPYEGKDGLKCTVVYPDTIGEYIGMKDCKDKEIFEGDILKIFNEIESHVGIVTYSFASWGIKNENGNLSISDILKRNLKGANYSFEILGNIHDNTELLKEE